MQYSKEDQLGRICDAVNDLALSDAKVGSIGVVERVDLPDDISHYLAHLGFLPGTTVEILRRAPAGDPRVYRIDGVEVGLRNETARHIYLSLTPTPTGTSR
ncbi:MAG: ferrous iron transport protein A [Acidobacteria bacterium]|nr:ferrous iron transport protein A [Acidobacteriota bacterium]